GKKIYLFNHSASNLEKDQKCLNHYVKYNKQQLELMLNREEAKSDMLNSLKNTIGGAILVSLLLIGLPLFKRLLSVKATQYTNSHDVTAENYVLSVNFTIFVLVIFAISLLIFFLYYIKKISDKKRKMGILKLAISYKK
ncbi:hypothetical protein D3P96_08260, partial [Weissella viridescens]